MLRYLITIFLCLGYWFVSAAHVQEQSALVQGLWAGALALALLGANAGTRRPGPTHWTDVDIADYARSNGFQRAILITVFVSLWMSDAGASRTWHWPLTLGAAAVLVLVLGAAAPTREALKKKRAQAIRSSSEVFE